MKIKNTFYLLLAFTFFSVNVYANDPLNKPKVWSLLQETPTDMSLWAAYLGKSWVCMNITEKENIKNWKQMLGSSAPLAKSEQHIRISTEQQKQIQEEVFHDEHEFWEGEELQSQVTANEILQEKQELKQHFEEMEQKMVQTPSAITSLSRNLRENFILIDDEFRMEFESLGLEYVGYWDKYPNGKYSPEKWVHERSMELKNLKKQQFEKIKSSMLASALSADGNGGH
ncbi:hypothetical protein [Flammeovirga sp. SJP92]|uniref:hypothetical protein n=1 Tax=Flammeovirga sp. SJP92 TaxID=1775430 RepID=UPI000788DDB0|nr:hypothetical protein [Flammeovirga sp. SJP92]KXX68562.1 hypothetical protein AVL50_22645 [Flammeovirga sp. SJP92]